MSYPPSGPPHPYTPPPPRKGMSTGAKIGIGCGGCATLVVFGFVGLMVVAALVAPSSDTSSSPSTTVEVDDTVTYTVGDTVSHGDWDITITEVEAGVDEVERSEYRAETPAGEFVVVHLEATNTSAEPTYFEGNDQVLMDSDGNLYRREVSASDISSLDRVNPGVTIEGFLGYDVPEGFVIDHILVNGDGRYADGVRVDLD